jgi:hypothetical protein
MRLVVSTDNREIDRRVRITFEARDVCVTSGKEIWHEISLAEWSKLISQPLRSSPPVPKDLKFK